MIIGIGTDLVDMRRIQRAWDKLGQAYLDEVFSQEEQTYCLRKNNQRIRATDETTLAGNSFAKMFAIKEATLKAIGLVDGIKWNDIIISHEPTGRPTVALQDTALTNLLAHCKETFCFLDKVSRCHVRYHVSVSDDIPYATAVVILEYLTN